MRAAFEPIYNAGLSVLNKMAVSWQWPIRGPLVEDQLHVLYPAIELCVEVSREGRECDLILLIVLVFPIYNMDRISEDTSWGEEPMDEFIPVGQIVLTFRALGSISTSLLAQRTDDVSQEIRSDVRRTASAGVDNGPSCLRVSAPVVGCLRPGLAEL